MLVFGQLFALLLCIFIKRNEVQPYYANTSLVLGHYQYPHFKLASLGCTYQLCLVKLLQPVETATISSTFRSGIRKLA